VGQRFCVVEQVAGQPGSVIEVIVAELRDAARGWNDPAEPSREPAEREQWNHGSRLGCRTYTHDGDIFSIDPIHASTDEAGWHHFLREFNQFAFEHNGVPLLNQSPFVERKHVEAAYSQRWFRFAEWVKLMDPEARMLNPFFVDLLSPSVTASPDSASVDYSAPR